MNTLPTNCVHTLSGHKGAILCGCFSSTGSYCFTGGMDQTIRLWNPLKGTSIFTFEGCHNKEVLGVAVDGLNATFASAGADKRVYVWDLQTTKSKVFFRGHESRVTCVSFGADNSILMSGSFDKTVRLWDMRSRTFTPIQILDDAKDGITHVESRGTSLFTGSTDGFLRAYDVRMGKMIADDLHEPITSFAVSHDGNCYLASARGGTLRLVDRTDGRVLNRYRGHLHVQYNVQCSFLTDDAFVACGSEDGSVFVWDLVTAEIATVLRGHTSICSSLSFCKCRELENIPLMMSTSADGTARILSNFEFNEKREKLAEAEKRVAPFMETRLRIPLL
ncbi:putative Protein will die slowly [Blattamonas nauphoetae]|uniref:Uncharacterized protein n=1 Tax=Blattamonas nauphoetae TaxID=2049346 RepID=A0ABQ9XMY3_9EUKA|nr:putative Protein will die slowly [Blattamonas nauphoetae]